MKTLHEHDGVSVQGMRHEEGVWLECVADVDI